MGLLSKFRMNDKGAVSVEYAIIISTISVVVALVLWTLPLADLFNGLAGAYPSG